MGTSISLIIVFKIAGLDGLRHVRSNSDGYLSQGQYSEADRCKCSDISVRMLLRAETELSVSRETTDFQKKPESRCQLTSHQSVTAYNL